MTSTDVGDERYLIEFSTDEPGVLENALTLGAATIVNEGLKKALDVHGHGWYCKITDSVTDLWESRHGATKEEAQQAAFRALKRKIDGFWEDHDKEKKRQDHAYQEQQAESPLPEHLSSSGDNSGTDFIVKLVVYGLIFFAILWFVFAVAIPLLMIDIAAMALIASLTRKHLSKWLLPLSVGGAVLVVVDYNQGWSTKSLATNVSFLAGLIPFLVYLNVLAGLIATYMLIRAFMDAKNPPSEHVGEFTKRNVIVMCSLLLVGCLTVGVQLFVDAQRKQARQSVATLQPTSITGRFATPIAGTDRATSGAAIATHSLVGTWQFEDDSTKYIQIVRKKANQFRLIECIGDCQGAISESPNPNDAILALTNGTLAGTLRSWNFRATHGTEFDYHLAVERIDDNEVLYTVTSDLGTETHKGRRIGGDPHPATGANSRSSTYLTAIVIDPPSNIRVAPSSASNIICSVSAVRPISILGSQGNWYKTDACGGSVGYIYRSQLKLIAPK